MKLRQHSVGGGVFLKLLIISWPLGISRDSSFLTHNSACCYQLAERSVLLRRSWPQKRYWKFAHEEGTGLTFLAAAAGEVSLEQEKEVPSSVYIGWEELWCSVCSMVKTKPEDTDTPPGQKDHSVFGAWETSQSFSQDVAYFFTASLLDLTQDL